jgi:TIR domain
MNETRPIYDVFISHVQDDAAIAARVAAAMKAYGLQVFTGTESVPDESLEDVIWEALAESQAFVLIVSDSELNGVPAFELGAAQAWKKPIYAIATRPAVTPLPVPLRGIPLFPLSRIDEVAQKVKQSLMSLSLSETSILVDGYREIGIPVDELFLEPEHLARLTHEFQRRAGRHLASEELVRMLLRLRKAGELRTSKARKAPKIA